MENLESLTWEIHSNKFVLFTKKLKNGTKILNRCFWILVCKITWYDSTCTNEITEEQATTVNFEINLKMDFNQWKGYGERSIKYWKKTIKCLTPLREYNY